MIRIPTLPEIHTAVQCFRYGHDWEPQPGGRVVCTLCGTGRGSTDADQ